MVDFSPDGELLAAAVTEDWEQLVRLWTVDGFDAVMDLEMDVRNFKNLSFSPDSSMLATAAELMAPTVWDLTDATPMFALDAGIDPDEGEGWYHPTRVAFTPDGGHVVVGYWNGTLELWRLPGAEELVAPEREPCEPTPIPGDVLFGTGSAGFRSASTPRAALPNRSGTTSARLWGGLLNRPDEVVPTRGTRT